MNSFSRRSIALLLTSSAASLQFDGPLEKRLSIRGLNSSSTDEGSQSNSKTDQPVTSDTTNPSSSSSAAPQDHSSGQGGSSTTPDGSSTQVTPAQNDKPTSTSNTNTTPDDNNKSSTNMTTTPVTSPSNTGSTSHSDTTKTNGTIASSAPASNAPSSNTTTSATPATPANSNNTTTPTNVTTSSTPGNSSASSPNATTSSSSDNKDNKTISDNTFPVNSTILFGNATNTSLDSTNRAAIGSNSISSNTPTTTDSNVGGAMATASGPVRPFAPNSANLASSGSSSHSGLKMWTAIIGGSVLGGLVLFVMLWYLLTWKMRTRKDVYRDMEVDFGPTAQDATWGPGADQAFPAQFPTLASSTSGSLSSSRQLQGFESPVDQRAGSRKDSVGALTRSDTNGSQPWHSAEYGGLEGPLPPPPLMHHNNEVAGFNRGAVGWDPTHERWNSEEYDPNNPNHGAFDHVPPQQVGIRHHASYNSFEEMREHQPYNARGGSRFAE